MNKDKEKWIEEVFESMEGSQRAKPSPMLFTKIKERIDSSNSKVAPIYQWSNYAAAVAVVFLVNICALISYNRNEVLPNSNVAAVDMYDEPLITSFQIYEDE